MVGAATGGSTRMAMVEGSCSSSFSPAAHTAFMIVSLTLSGVTGSVSWFDFSIAPDVITFPDLS
jgi:hypothetical protein